MLPRITSLSLLVLIATCLTICFPTTSAAEETYLFERMWPTLQQPWYFDPFGIAQDASRNIYITDSINEKVVKLNAEGQLITEWKSANEFDIPWNPSGIAISDSQFIYVADRRHMCIKKFDLNAHYIGQWGTPGTEDGEFDFYDEATETAGGYIAVDAVGNVYVADTANHRIQKFDPDGEYLGQWGSFGTGDGQFNAPAALIIDASNHIYIIDGYNDRVQKFTLDGVFVTKWGSHGDQPGQFNFWQHHQDSNLDSTGITIDKQGNIVVVDNENYRIQTFDPNGIFLKLWGGDVTHGLILDSPGGIVIDPMGNHLLADGSKKIYKFTPEGVLITQWGSSGTGDGEFKKPLGVGLDDNGNVYVCDTSNFRIQKFTAEGQFISQIDTMGDNYWSPWGMAVDGDGTVYAVGVSALCEIEQCEHSIKKYNPDGTLERKWGEYGTGDGQFIVLEKPTDMAIDSSRNVYVIDIGNHRIQKFNPDGGFLAKWGGPDPGLEIGQFNFLQHYGAGIAIDQNSDLVYVVGGGNGRVQKFALSGTSPDEWNSYGTNPLEKLLVVSAVTVDEDHNVLVDFSHPPFGLPYTGGIMKFTPDGDFIDEYLEPGSGPGQFVRPHDLAVAANGKLYVVDHDHNRLQAFKKVDTLPNDRAIVLAGGGPYPSNNLWDATQMCANFAYRTLTMQGYTKENIFYLTADTDLDLDSNGEEDDVDGDATNSNLQNAITSWAAGAQSLVIYLVDHGGEHTFRMSGTETLTASQLDTWLDTLQNTMTGNLIVVYDACESGSFLSALTPETGKSRIVVASTSPGESAYFVSQGMVSFSNYFWTHTFNGLPVKEAYSLAKTSIQYTTDYQHPQLDINGDGISEQADLDNLPDSIYIGSGTVVSGDIPVIDSVSADQLITDTNVATVWAAGVTDANGISRVWATIRPPDYNQGSSGNPVQNLPSVELLPAGTDRFEVTYNGFNSEGTYQMVIYARDQAGNTSVPRLTNVAVNSPLRRKAIIVAGGPASGTLWPAVGNCAMFAYEALKFQGYTDEDIFFMSPDTAPDGVDAYATHGNLSYAVNVWARTDTQDLAVYLVGSGENETFHINTSETLSPAQLNSWLDSLQGIISGTVTVVYDADYAGSFVSYLQPPENKDRILMASTSANGIAQFPVDGNISFSAFFWQKVMNGANLRDTFVYVKNAIGYALQGQVPVLDDSGNGLPNEPGIDGRLARNYTLGAGIVLAGDDPLIGDICPAQELTVGTSAQIWVEDVTTTGSIANVWAAIALQGDETGVFSYEAVMLPLSPVGNGSYAGTYDGFNLFGTYSVSVYAMDDNANISQPKETQINKKVGLDLYEEDDTFDQAKVIHLLDVLPQRHSFHDQGDEDWVKFYAVQGEPYEIKVSDVGAACDVVIEVYGTNSSTLLDSQNAGFEEEEEFLTWTCPLNGIYYIRIYHFIGSSVPGFGENAEYKLSIYRPTGILISLLVKGMVTDAKTGTPVPDAGIHTSDNASAVTLPNGSYKMPHPPGTWNFTISAPDTGYPPAQYANVGVQGEFEQVLNFKIYPDSDGDGLNDAQDGCPDDIVKTEPGICGCGEVDVPTDTDGDNAADCVDMFIDNPLEWQDSDGDGMGNNADNDDDNDGIADAVEAAAPNGGDSNQDGVADSLQNHVASFKAYTGEGYMVIESPDGTTLSNCQAADNPSPDDMPVDWSFLFGFFDFTINDIGTGESTFLKITLPQNQIPSTYYKYGRTPDDLTDHWYEFLYNYQTGAQIIDNVILLYFVDALQGDDELQQDSKVIDLGGPGFSATIDNTVIGGNDSTSSGGGGGGCFISSVSVN